MRQWREDQSADQKVLVTETDGHHPADRCLLYGKMGQWPIFFVQCKFFNRDKSSKRFNNTVENNVFMIRPEVTQYGRLDVKIQELTNVYLSHMYDSCTCALV